MEKARKSAAQQRSRNGKPASGERASARDWRDVATSLIQSEQQSKCRLAERLHGELQQLLTVALMRTWAAKRRTNDDQVRGVLSEVEAVVRESIDETRTLTLDLSPPVLRHSNLEKSLEWIAESSTELYDVPVELSMDGGLASLPSNVQQFLFDAVREVLLTRIAEAGIRKARIAVARRQSQLVISILDEPGKPNPGKAGKIISRPVAMTFQQIAERVEVLGGSFSSAPAARGLRTELTVPLALDQRSAAAVAEPLFRAAPSGGVRVETAELPAGVVRVLLAEDHRMVREGLVRLINSERDLRVVAEAANGEKAIELASAVKPDVVVLDVNMPVCTGSEAARRIRENLPDVGIIGLSEYGDTVTERAMREAGAGAYLCKDGAFEELCRAIRVVADQARSNRPSLQAPGANRQASTGTSPVTARRRKKPTRVRS